MVLNPSTVFIQKSAHAVRLEEPAPARVTAEQNVFKESLMLGSHPFAYRDAKTHFSPPDVRTRYEVRGDFLQQIFARSSPYLAANRQSRAVFDDLVVKEWRSPLDGVRHGGDVHLDEQVVGKVRLQVGGEQRVDSPAVRPRVPCYQICQPRIGAVTVQLAEH